ncbi:helix-turn-helix domain-containing protein [Actinacidiphila paucisporea]|uniref:Helix-turn-helix domain-containing protein n=1 Tax=Actinacidiphila paucisporea TaxID=310782 RepID=A0A1M6Z730_9ACTN|nr:helix-turn-helix transcriptional regulator [Actinacidiphila paucisporea]SHL26215.1 Helix-turn-helix domain-containing protein [Actinacidiphila paucisporea]
MTERLDAPPEGVLIKRAAVAARLSQREAARRADISETRWRQLVSGYQVVSRAKVPVRSPDDTLARMARAVGVTAEQLEEAGRAGAAAALREAEAEEEAAPAGRSPDAGPGEPGNRVDERWHLVQAVLRQARAGLTASEYETLAGRITAYVSGPAAPADEPGDAAP